VTGLLADSLWVHSLKVQPGDAADPQWFITVEDFFGGFVIGVLVAYQGTAYFENLLNHTTSTGTSTPPPSQ
jgi:hypothetical protein